MIKRYPKSFDSEQDAKPFLLQNFIEPDELIPGFTSKINPAKVQIHQENRSGRLEESYTINPEYTKWSIKPQASENFVEDLTDTEFDAPVENEPSISIIRRRHNIKRENEESPYSYSFSWEDVIDQNRDGSPQYREELRGQFSQMRNPKEDLSYLSLDSSSDLEINLNESPESFREFKRSRNVDRPYNYHELFETPRRSNIQESFNSQNSNTRRKVMKEKLAPRENNLMNTRDENFTPMAHSSFREK
ncbi:uncharacterized protein [Prorops nasuta]|uniref:uncharacterized protein n=1 Tax=Prorops nasuta TaxID=863751 RepID=UPI0034CDD85F